MDGATPAAYKEMRDIVKYVLDTETYGLRVEPKLGNFGKWEMVVYTDSDWKWEMVVIQIVTGMGTYLIGVPILWKLKLQRTVALSSSKAEYYAFSEASK